MSDDVLVRLRTDRSAASALEIGAILHVARPLFTDLLATLCFYAAYAATGSVGVATILATALGVAQFIRVVAKGRSVPAVQWASLLLVIVVGGISLLTGDARYVLYKAAIVYLVIGATMLRPGWLLRYVPPIAAKYLSRGAIVAFGYMWSALLIATGLMSVALTLAEPARTVALVMGIWAPASKIVLLAGQYLGGRAIVRRNVIAALRESEAAGVPGA
jgi:intracellular septation protein